jgi:hypothetical protein
MKKYSLFHIEGGLGKHVAATAVAKCIKNNHPDRELLVVCAYPEIFINLNYVNKVFRVGNTPYFYQDYIKNQDTLIFKHEPYFTTDHISGKSPLIQNWCKLYDLNYLGEQPELVFNVRQIQHGYRKWSRQKPVMVIQTNGGPLQQDFPYSWTRDIPYPVAESLVNFYSNDYHIIQVCRHEDNKISGCEHVIEPMSNMELFSLLLVSQKRILIDSCLQHAAAALNKKSTVLWVGTSPRLFGYDVHDNFTAVIDDNIKLPDSYLFDFSFNGVLHECPLMDFNIFDMDSIIHSINNQQ